MCHADGLTNAAGLVDSDGNRVVSYEYDSRGKILGIYEFLKKRYYGEWRFWWHKGGGSFIVPMNATMEEIEKLETPPQNKKLLITYYRFSKIFIDYKTM